MTAKIQTLPPEVIHLMAAGEVIDSLAAVVRELVENALDAGATRITVALYPEVWRVRVADNGCGISLLDLQQAAHPHTTSKIHDSQDLWAIQSLGFRGEALHSLAQLADLEICSRLAAEPAGWRVVYNRQGAAELTEHCAIAPGTVVTVQNLFDIWPARRQALPALPQQLRRVQTTLQHLALCHPHITWQVTQNDREWFSIWPGNTAKAVLPQLLRDLEPGDLQELTVQLPEFFAEGVSSGSAEPNHDNLPVYTSSSPGNSSARSRCPALYLLIGLPDRCHRYRSDWVQVAVNGRVVRVPELEQTIIGAFRRMLPRDRHPVCFLHLDVTAAQVDWNRHPAKAEIYLNHLEEWRSQVLVAIDEALRLSPAKLADVTYSSRVGQVLKAAETDGVYAHSRSIAPETQTASADQIRLPLRAIAQVHKMYILAEHPTGMWLVEQHIAHERVLYEQLSDRWQLVLIQPALTLQNLTTAQVAQLQRIGLEVEPFGEQLWAVRTVPEPLAHREDCLAALTELSLGGDLQSALVATACRTAIRNGMPLTLSEMQTLLNQWQQTHRPHTCPHGRPIYLSLEESSLSRFFRRHWVIGKSHGI